MGSDTTWKCECRADWDLMDPPELHAAHLASDEHFRALADGWDADDWQKFVDDIDNGLGWAENEGMGSGDRSDIIGVTRLLIAEWRK